MEDLRETFVEDITRSKFAGSDKYTDTVELYLRGGSSLELIGLLFTPGSLLWRRLLMTLNPFPCRTMVMPSDLQALKPD